MVVARQRIHAVIEMHALDICILVVFMIPVLRDSLHVESTLSCFGRIGGQVRESADCHSPESCPADPSNSHKNHSRNINASTPLYRHRRP